MTHMPHCVSLSHMHKELIVIFQATLYLTDIWICLLYLSHTESYDMSHTESYDMRVIPSHMSHTVILVILSHVSNNESQ